MMKLVSMWRIRKYSGFASMKGMVIMKLAKNLIYPKNIKRVILALLLVIAISFVTVGAVYDVALKNVTLVQTDEFAGTSHRSAFKTRKSTVGEFLEENEVSIKENDVVSMDVDAEISDNDVLIIRTGRLVELTADGETKNVIVTKPTVGESLAELGVELSETDKTIPEQNEPITENMSVTVDRYTTEYIVENEVIEFDTKRTKDSSLEEGKTKVIESGKNGAKEVTYSLLKKNGEVISKDFVSENVTENPVTRVISEGTKKVKKAAAQEAAKTKSAQISSGNTVHGYSYSKKLTVTATAYDKSLTENGGHTKTAMGLNPGYGIVAVDPKVIPLGTKLYIESPDGGKSWSYGYCIAGDTGGAIKGNKVDLCFETNKECVRFGRRSATVYILN